MVSFQAETYLALAARVAAKCRRQRWVLIRLLVRGPLPELCKEAAVPEKASIDTVFVTYRWAQFID